MPVNLLPVVEPKWPPELTPPGVRGAIRRESLERYAARMRERRTPSTRVVPKLPTEPPPYEPPRFARNSNVAMTRQCFVCLSWKWCEHREADLVGFYRLNRR